MSHNNLEKAYTALVQPHTNELSKLSGQFDSLVVKYDAAKHGDANFFEIEQELIDFVDDLLDKVSKFIALEMDIPVSYLEQFARVRHTILNHNFVPVSQFLEKVAEQKNQEKLIASNQTLLNLLAQDSEIYQTKIKTPVIDHLIMFTSAIASFKEILEEFIKNLDEDSLKMMPSLPVLLTLTKKTFDVKTTTISELQSVVVVIKNTHTELQNNYFLDNMLRINEPTKVQKFLFSLNKLLWSLGHCLTLKNIRKPRKEPDYASFWYGGTMKKYIKTKEFIKTKERVTHLISVFSDDGNIKKLSREGELDKFQKKSSEKLKLDANDSTNINTNPLH